MNQSISINLFKTKNYVWVIALFTAMSCDHKVSHTNSELFNEETNYEVIEALNSDVRLEKTNSIYEIIEIIPLETNNEVLLAECSKVQSIRDYYYVLDKKFSSLKIFDTKGGYIKTVGKLGRGPGEFQGVNDFNLDLKNNRIVVYSLADMRLFYFDLEGEFLESVLLDFYAYSFEIITGNKLAFYINYNRSEKSENYNLVITDFNGKIKKKMMPFPQEAQMAISFSGMLKSFQNEFVYNHAFSDTLLILNSDFKVQKSLIVDMKGFEWKHGFNFTKLYEVPIGELAFMGKSCFLTDSFLFTNMVYKQRTRNLLINRKDGSVFNEYNQPQDFLMKLIRTPHLTDKEGHFVSSLTASSYQAFINTNPELWEVFNRDYPELTKDLKIIENSEKNPVLIKFKVNVHQ